MTSTSTLRVLLLVARQRATLPPGRAYLSTRDVAAVCCRTMHTVRGWVRFHGLPAEPHGSRGWLYLKREAFADWLEANPWARSPRDRHLASLARRLEQEMRPDVPRTPRVLLDVRFTRLEEGSP